MAALVVVETVLLVVAYCLLVAARMWSFHWMWSCRVSMAPVFTMQVVDVSTIENTMLAVVTVSRAGPPASVPKYRVTRDFPWT